MELWGGIQNNLTTSPTIVGSTNFIDFLKWGRKERKRERERTRERERKKERIRERKKGRKKIKTICTLGMNVWIHFGLKL